MAIVISDIRWLIDQLKAAQTRIAELEEQSRFDDYCYRLEHPLEGNVQRASAALWAEMSDDEKQAWRNGART